VQLAETSQATAARSAGGFASLIAADDLTLGVVLLALGAAFLFGAVHALEPGHGKTLVAAYFVGVKGTARQALTLGLIVAVTHTVGVLAIGLVAIFGSQYILPERLYPWLTLIAAVMVLGLGLRLIAARGGGRILHALSHRLPFGNHHHHHEASAPDSGVPPWRSLIALGLADGLTPSPSALVVLLAAVSLDRVGLGIGLIMAFSAGLATVLAVVSLVLLYARQVMDGISRRFNGVRLPVLGPVGAQLSADGAVMRVLPLGGAMALVGVGLVLLVRALEQPGLSF
jgi:ABC-type nickel/cobalt efflux system permease component RcnA